MRAVSPRSTKRAGGRGRASLRAALRTATVVSVMTVGALVLTSCSSKEPVVVTVTEGADSTSVASPTVTVPTDTGATEPTTPTSEETTAPAAEQARVSATPTFGSTDVGPKDPVSVMAFHGTIDSVTMVSGEGVKVDGEIVDGNQWVATGQRDYGQEYTISGSAIAADGTRVPFDGTISTISPKKAEIDSAGEVTNAAPDTFLPAYMQIPDGATVGIAAPIVITFGASVADRAAAEEALHVTVNGEEIEGSWGWMQDEDIQGKGIKQSRVHFRPQDYWPAHAEVHVEASLQGVNYGSGWGVKDIVRTFNIGEKMIVKADVDSHRLLVIVDDEIVKNYPVSYGVPSSVDDGRTTVSGIHVITDKHEEYEMCNPKYGYCGFEAQWAVRINNNGEFIHVNKQTEAAGVLGKANVSHGCVNMGMKDGEDFYNRVYYGVPVDVEGTGVDMGYGDYIWDWSVSYDTWKSFSAL